MPTTIDHEAYPHLFDAILAQAPLGALIPLRATCRSIRDRIDELLFAHVELHSFPTPTGPRVLVMTPPLNSTLSTTSEFPRLPYVPSAVRTMDIAIRDGLMVPETAGFSRLETMRPFHRRSGAALFQPKTVVQRVSTTELAMAVQVPPSARRLVLHVQYDAVPPHRKNRIAIEGSVTDFVLVFWPEKAHSAPRVPTASWLFHCLQNILPLEGEYTLAIVGLERVLTPALDAIDEPAQWFEANRAQIRAHCLDRYPRLRQSKAGLAFVDNVFARTRFLEYDEWRDELGDEQREIEGTWSVTRRGPMVSACAWVVLTSRTLGARHRRLGRRHTTSRICGRAKSALLLPHLAPLARAHKTSRSASLCSPPSSPSPLHHPQWTTLHSPTSSIGFWHSHRSTRFCPSAARPRPTLNDATGCSYPT